MPRTKRPVKKVEKPTEGSNSYQHEALKKLDKLVAMQKKKIAECAQMEARNIELAFKILLGTFSSRQLNMTIGQMKNELYLKEVTTTGPTPRQGARSASHDDGYITENSSHGSGERAGKKLMVPLSSNRSTRRSRSANASSRKQLPTAAKKTAQRRRSSSVYHTPAYNKNGHTNYPPITPKVAPHTSLTVLRQPRQGEMIVSMTGSPVMVPTYSSMQGDEKANCNIKLQDGTMLSLQPKQLRQSQAYIPFSLMDQNVLEQLKTLKDNLDTVLRIGEKAVK